MRSATRSKIAREVVAIAEIIILVRLLGDPQKLLADRWRLTLYLGALLCIPIQLCLHEAAHAVTAAVLGRRVHGVVLGSGPRLFTVKVKGCPVEVHLWPWSGVTRFSPPRAGDPHRAVRQQGIIAAAGPAVNGLIAIAAVVCMPLAQEFFLGVVITNVLLLTDNLWPTTVRVGGTVHGTDGVAVRAAFMGPKPTSDVERARTLAVEEALSRSRQGTVTALDILTGIVREPVGEGGTILRNAGLTPAVLRGLQATASHELIARQPRAPATTPEDPTAPPMAGTRGLLLEQLKRPGVPELLRRIGVNSEGLTEAVAAGIAPTPGIDSFFPSAALPNGIAAALPLERLSGPALTALSAAYEAAQSTGVVGTRQLLTGLMSDPLSISARTLRRFGLTPKRGSPLPSNGTAVSDNGITVTAELVQSIGLGLTTPLFGERQVLGTESLLIGLFNESESSTQKQFQHFGITQAALIATLDQELATAPFEMSTGTWCTMLRPLIETRAMARLKLGRHVEARSDFLTLAAVATSPRQHAINLNNAAWAGLMSGDATLRSDAFQLSSQAIAAIPDHDAIRGTWAFALIENDRAAEGVAVIEPQINQSAPERAALQRCVLAIGLARLGRRRDAARFADEARNLDATCPLLDRAATAIAA